MARICEADRAVLPGGFGCRRRAAAAPAASMATIVQRDVSHDPTSRMVSLTNCLAGAVGTETSGLVALQRLFDYQFSPRLANLGDARLWRIDRKADYGPFNSLSKGTINLALIRENWPDVIRLA